MSQPTKVPSEIYVEIQSQGPECHTSNHKRSKNCMASLLELVMCSGMHSVKKCDFYHTDRCGENLHTHTHPPKKIDIQQFICMVAQYC